LRNKRERLKPRIVVLDKENVNFGGILKMNAKCVLCDAQINNEKDSFVIAQLYVRGEFRKSYYVCSECVKRDIP